MTKSVTHEPSEELDSTVGVKELGHVVLFVRNAERSAKFYRDVLGWHQLSPPHAAIGAPVALFSGGRTHHELLLIEVGEDATPIPNGRRIGMYHFGLKVGDSDAELRSMIERLDDNGIALVGSADHGATHSLYLKDPDGNEVELYIDVPGVDWSDVNAVAGPAKPLRL